MHTCEVCRAKVGGAGYPEPHRNDPHWCSGRCVYAHRSPMGWCRTRSGLPYDAPADHRRASFDRASRPAKGELDVSVPSV